MIFFNISTEYNLSLIFPSIMFDPNHFQGSRVGNSKHLTGILMNFSSFCNDSEVLKSHYRTMSCKSTSLHDSLAIKKLAMFLPCSMMTLEMPKHDGRLFA